MPPRKTSPPPPYATRRQTPTPLAPALRNIIRRDKLRWVILGILGILSLTWLFRRGSSKSSQGGGWSGAHIPKIPIGSGPPVVLVTVIDPDRNATWTAAIKKNREGYAKRHGYKTFFPTPSQYKLAGPKSWSRVPAMRHAMTLHPGSEFFWYIDVTSLIMTPSIAIHKTLLAPSPLEAVLMSSTPIVPPDSLIKTFSNVEGNKIDFIITQDRDGLSTSSFVVRNGEWAKFFLDAWFDPIYRSYNFQKAESHALEHIVQWHGTILAKLGLVPQALLNAYAFGAASENNGKFKPGDLVATFPGCDKEEHSCARAQEEYLKVLAKSGD